MKCGSLFSGIEGIGLGLERAGMTVQFQCEIDAACNRVLERRFPGVDRFKDVTKVGADDLPAVDVLTGGFPCQDLSVAGRRAGLAGKRSGLFYEFMRIASELSPRWVLIENVPGLLSSNGGRDMGAVVGTLAELGYGWAYRVLDAQYFGVAQRRRRVFVVGCLGDARRAAQVLFEPESCAGHPAPSRSSRQRVAASLTAGTSASSGVSAPGRRREDDVNLVAGVPTGNTGERGDGSDSLVLAPTLTHHHGRNNASDEPFVIKTAETGANGSNVSQGTSYTLDGAGPPAVAGFIPHASSGSRSIGYEEEVAPTLKREAGGNKASVIRIGGDYADPTVSVDDKAFLAANAMSDRQMAVHTGSLVRRLTPLECERLQGFPDGWTEGEADSARYRMLGNAVCVPVAEWIGKRMMEVAA